VICKFADHHITAGPTSDASDVTEF